MGYTTETWKDYAIGAGVGLVLYHFVLRKQFPTLPKLSNTGTISVDQIIGIDIEALSICKQNGLM